VLLFGFANRRLDFVFTFAIAALLAWVRFAHLADGPWEWDETAFARAVLDFDLAAYFPHPPGYPGWIAIGHLFNAIAPEPLVALQWASAGFSVLALWPLAALGRRVAPPAVAAAAALLVLVAPGPALYAVRGFSSTTAAVLALAAAAVAVGGLAGRRLTLFTILVAAAFLVRPNLLPPLAVLWVGVAIAARSWRRLWPGVAIALTMGGVSLGLMAKAEGGFGALLAVFMSHSQRHFSRLAGNPSGILDLGLVKGFGGGFWAAAFMGAALTGLLVWNRRVGRRPAVLWAAVLSVAIVQLVWMQNRSYCRYAVGVQMAVAPLVAGASALVPPAAGCGVLLAGAGWLGWTTRPILREQHDNQLAAWHAVQHAQHEASRRDMAVVVESEMHLFASYLWLREQERGFDVPPWVLSPWDPEPWQEIDRPYLVATVHRHLYPPSLVGRERRWNGVSDRLLPLTQQRFLTASVVIAPPLPFGEWWPMEAEPGGLSFMWGGRSCDLLLPPLPDPTEVEIAFRPAPADAPLEVEWNGERLAEVDVDEGRFRIRIDSARVRGDDMNSVSFRRTAGYRPGDGDNRELAVQLFEVRAVAPNLPWSGSLVGAKDRDRLGVRLTGHHPPEDFGASGAGVWLEPAAAIEIPAGPGRLMLEIWGPRPLPPDTVIRIGGSDVVGPFDLASIPQEVVLPIAEQHLHEGVVKLEFESVPYSPATAGHGDDDRQLGVVVSGIRFEPADPPAWARPLVHSVD